MDENQNKTQDGQNVDERIPAPVKCEKKLKIWRTVACVAGAVLIAAAGFATGMCVRWYSIDPQMRTLIKVKEKIDDHYYEEVTDEKFYGALFGAVNQEILDGYSGYMTPEEYAALTSDLKGNRAGLGLVLLTQSAAGQEQMLVTRVCGNSPAEKAGIAVGSYVVGFGASENTITLSQSYDEFSEFLTDYDAGEKFYIRIAAGEAEKTVEISREEYVENYVFYRTNDSAYAFETSGACQAIKGGAELSCLQEDEAYIRIVQFTGNAEKAFEQAMKLFKAEGKKHLVLDLRGNGGGYLETMQGIASYFCKDATWIKPVVAIADYGEKQEKFHADKNVYKDYFSTDSRICVLADEDSASASECLLGCMLDYGAIEYADICLTEYGGRAKTFGKGIMQTTYLVNILDGDAIKLTTAKILWPVSKNCIHDRGVLSTDGTKTVARDYTGENELINAIKSLWR